MPISGSAVGVGQHRVTIACVVPCVEVHSNKPVQLPGESTQRGALPARFDGGASTRRRGGALLAGGKCRSRRGTPVGFVRFVAAKEVEVRVSLGDGLLDAANGRKPARLLVESRGIDAALIGERRAGAGEVVFGRDRLRRRA